MMDMRAKKILKTPKEDTLEQRHLWAKVYFVNILVFLFALAIIIRIFDVMWVQGDELLKQAQDRGVKYEQIDAVRGNIYSQDSSLMATSLPYFTIRMDLHPKVVIKDTFNFYIKALCDSLTKMFPDQSSQSYLASFRDARSKKNRSFTIKQNLNYAQMSRMRNFPIFKKGQYKGGTIIDEYERRTLPNKELAARTIGYYNPKVNIGVGLELAYNKDLTGTSGQRLVQRVAKGVWKPIYSQNTIEPQNGRDVISTIDMRIQDVAHAALKRCLILNEAEHGCAVLMEVKTGQIRAIANLQRNPDGTYSENLNFAISESAEPGSTFKLVSSLIALESGRVDTNLRLPTGSIAYADRTMKDSEDHGLGKVSLKRAFEISSNVGISTMINDLYGSDPRKYTDAIYRLGLNKKLGIELEGEGQPYIKNNTDPSWSSVSLPWMSIGYELKLTPLQILSIYNAVANDGVKVRPQFVSEIKQGNDVIQDFQPVVLVDKIASNSTLRKLRSMLEGVVQEGTARSLSKSPYKIAGKTGTAQMNYGTRGQEKMTYRASFVGYFPADKPMYSCIVVITNPQKNRKYGGEVAAPVFKEIGDKVYASLLRNYIRNDKKDNSLNAEPSIAFGPSEDLARVYRDFNIKSSLKLDNITVLKLASGDKSHYVGLQIRNDVVPNLTGLGARDAIYILSRLGISCRINGLGIIKSQSIPAGSPIIAGQKMTLNLVQ